MEEDTRFVLELMIHYKSDLFKIMTSKLGPYVVNDIEDCYQDLFMLAFLNRRKLCNHPNPVGWLFITAGNIANDKQRKNRKNERRTVSIEDAEEISCPEQMEDDILDRSSSPQEEPESIKEQILDTLSSKEKELYRLKYIEKKDNKYIARYFTTTEGCIRAWLSQMRKHVRKIIEKQMQ